MTKPSKAIAIVTRFWCTELPTQHVADLGSPFLFGGGSEIVSADRDVRDEQRAGNEERDKEHQAPAARSARPTSCVAFVTLRAAAISASRSTP